MTAISIQVEGQNGLTWARWIALSAEVEALGFAGLFRSSAHGAGEIQSSCLA
jgi:hypothetical protein